MQKKILASSPRQLLNGQGVLRIFAWKLLQKMLQNVLGLDLEAGMLGVFLAEERRCAKN